LQKVKVLASLLFGHTTCLNVLESPKNHARADGMESIWETGHHERLPVIA
jgi:hypothetical protein